MSDDEIKPCASCTNNPSYSHIVEHLENSLKESDYFEVCLNEIIDDTAKRLEIDKSAAMNIALERIRDMMRARGHEDFTFDRELFLEEED